MASIRRYGPSMVSLEVMPRPEFGNGAQKALEVFEGAFDSVNKFIRPEVVRVKTAQGEQAAIDALETTGPKFELGQTRGPGNVAVEVLPGQAARGDARGPTRDKAGPTAENAKALEAGKKSFDFFAFATGGATRPDSFEGMRPNFKTKMQALIEAAPPGIREGIKINSGYRSPERQAVLWKEALAKYGSEAEARKWVAPPGKSQHGHGNAADVKYASDEVRAWMHENAPSFGLAYPLGNEPWHIEDADARGKGGTPGTAPTNVNVPTGPEYELRQINQASFEPRRAFTVGDLAFNAAADRVIQSRAMVALDDGLAIAQQKANGDLGVLKTEMDKVRSMVMGSLPKEMPGLRTALEESFTRSQAVATRQAIDLSQRRVMAQQTEAMGQAIGAIQGESERLALTGASGGEIAAHMATSQQALARFGPREGFTLNGQDYPPDPARAGTMTPGAIAEKLAGITVGTRKIMIESEFQRSAAPGQFVDEFRRQVFAGNSPLPPGESLNLLRELEGRARATESARRTEANAARSRVKEETDTRINAFVSLTEAGVPVAIPLGERNQILTALSPFPDLQREAMEKFAVADAAVATHNLSGPELLAYVGSVRSDVSASVQRGELDLEGVAVIQSLEDRVKKIQDAVTAEMVGLPMVEQLALDGAGADNVDWDGMRAQAVGNQKVIDQVNQVEAFYRDIEAVRYLSADERETVLEEARATLTELAASGQGYGAGALQTQKVIDSLEEWSNKRTALAGSDPVKFAEVVGVKLPSFDGVDGLGDIGKVLAERISLIKPATLGEGVENPVPLNRAEIDGLADIYRGSPPAAQMNFIGSIAGMGQDQADAVFKAIGQSEPTLYAAGSVYLGGNQAAASVILRGSGDVKMEGGTTLDISTARAGAMGELMTANLVTADSIKMLDATAKAYATGMALADGGRAISIDDLDEGYQIALGRQADGTGGIAATEYGVTIAPKGWKADVSFWEDGKSISQAIGSIDDAKLATIAGGKVTDSQGREFDARTLRNNIEGLRPMPDDPFILVPTDAEGGVFLTQPPAKETAFRPYMPGTDKPRDNGDGSYSTEVIVTVDAPGGGVWNIPSMWFGKDGPKDVTEDQASKLAQEYEKATGNTFPRFASAPEAVKAAEARSAAGGASDAPLYTPGKPQPGILTFDLREF